MSLKTKRHKTNKESQNMEMQGSNSSPSPGSLSSEDMRASGSSTIGRSTLDRVDTVVRTVNSNRLLIGGIAAGCGAAIFLLTTQSGRSLRNGIRTRSEDLYDLMTEQVSKRWNQVRGLAEETLTSEAVEQASDKIRRIA